MSPGPGLDLLDHVDVRSEILQPPKTIEKSSSPSLPALTRTLCVRCSRCQLSTLHTHTHSAHAKAVSSGCVARKGVNGGMEVRQAQQKRNCFGSPATETHWPISMFCLAQSAAPRAHLEAVTTGNPWADFHPYPLTNALHRGGLRPSVVSIINTQYNTNTY